MQHQRGLALGSSSYSGLKPYGLMPKAVLLTMDSSQVILKLLEAPGKAIPYLHIFCFFVSESFIDLTLLSPDFLKSVKPGGAESTHTL